MARSIRRLLLCTVFSVALLGARYVSAQVVLKPNGQNAVPLRTKAIAADVTIRGPVAVTRLTLTFQNETSERIEADFLYTLPPETLVTSFAYWYGDEKVIARVVEKDRAAAIYKHITDRMRDPALVEMIGKNTFRARIFPVMPNSDLKVEMTLIQTLASNREGLRYTLPLRQEKGNALDSVHVDAKIAADPSIERVLNNIGLPVQQNPDGYQLTLAGSHYRPQKDLQIRLLRKVQPLHAALYAAPSGGRDGFFALALTPDHSLAHPSVRIRGVTTYQVVPESLPNVKANRSLMLCGRYRGSGTATVELVGWSPMGRRVYTQAVLFGAKRETNNPAAELWAARRIAVLSAHAENRNAVIALSRRFTLPSKFTSWLAVPHEEWIRYHLEKTEADIEVVASQLIEKILKGHTHEATTRRLWLRLDELCRVAGREAHETGISMYNTMSYLAEKIVSARHSVHPNRTLLADMERTMARLNEANGVKNDDYVQAAEWRWAYSERERLRNLIVTERLQMKPDMRKVHRSEKQFIAIYDSNAIHDKAFGQLRLDRIAARTDGERLDRKIEAEQVHVDAKTLADLRNRREELRKREEELRARMGDPLIRVEAPADAQQVVALMPDGDVKPLTFNPAHGCWEARFDIPVYAQEGEYVITIVIVLKDGTRKTLTMRYHVDLTPPTGHGSARMVTDPNPTLRLEIEASAETARVEALLPWGELATLKPSTEPGRFYAAVPLPSGYRGETDTVTFLLTDRAHNRATVTVEWTPNREMGGSK